MKFVRPYRRLVSHLVGTDMTLKRSSDQLIVDESESSEPKLLA